MKIIVTLLAGLVLSACSTQLTKEEAALCSGDEKCLEHKLEVKVEEIQYNREVRRIAYLERYETFKLRCEATRQNVWIVRKTTTSPRCRNHSCPPKFGDSYTCGPPPSVQRY